jgi:hypothetical protein
MSAFRIAVRAVVPRVRPSTLRASPSLLRRGYADVASDKLRVTLSLPHQVRSSFATPPPLYLEALVLRQIA